jgi:putative Flp pilus-assembly TadE/G-like protein
VTAVGRGPRPESGQATILIVGLATVLAMGVAVVTDASAAYLQRQGLDNLADGAALAGADLGAAGDDVYTGGIGDDRLAITEAEARAAVQAYLQRAGAHTKYPGLTAYVSADPGSQTIRVRLTAPLHLPLKVPGGQESAVIGATGAAVVAVDD